VSKFLIWTIYLIVFRIPTKCISDEVLVIGFESCRIKSLYRLNWFPEKVLQIFAYSFVTKVISIILLQGCQNCQN
jgi:hypothetical protein